MYVSRWTFSLVNAIRAFAAQVNSLFGFYIYVYDSYRYITNVTLFLYYNNTTCHISRERYGNHDHDPYSGHLTVIHDRTAVDKCNVVEWVLFVICGGWNEAWNVFGKIITFPFLSYRISGSNNFYTNRRLYLCHYDSKIHKIRRWQA
jgi:hypothetical protein